MEVLEGEIGDPDGLPVYRMKTALASEGISERLVSLGILSLEHGELIQGKTASDYNDNQYVAYRLTEKGREQLLSQYAEIKRREEEKQRQALQARPAPAFDADLDDDVPF